MLNIDNIPEKTGVYVFKDIKGKIIYIGKANNLQKRIKQYFNKHNDNRIQIPLIQKYTKEIDYFITIDEYQALILEYELIKKHKPRYNVRLKDNTKYPYIKITDEQFPRIIYVWRKDGQGIYFGPFTSINFMNTIINTINTIYGLRTCKNFKKGKACIEYQMKKCNAPCLEKISQIEYNKKINEIKNMLSGNNNLILKKLNEQMHIYAAQQEYEKAAQIRDAVYMLRKHIKKGIKTGLKNNKDVIAIKREKNHGAICIVQMRNGIVNNIITKRFNAPASFPDNVIIRDIISQHYYLIENLNMDVIIVPTDIDREFVFLKSKVKIKTIDRSLIDKMLYEIAEENAMKLLSQYLKRDYIPPSIMNIKTIFKLKKTPQIIIGVDISHFSGKWTTGAIVMFKNGKPFKRGYRYYKLEYMKNNDYKAIEHILDRFLKKYQVDMLFVDGGIGQLNIAKEIVKKNKQNIYVFSLAKRLDKLYDMKGNIVMISRQSSALKLIKQIRDESHRFANKLRKKLMNIK